jgi:hypothetical protein
MDFNQAAPAGFLFLEKAATTLFGDGEYSLRVIPLVAGIIGMVVFPFLARRVLGDWGTVVAVGLFALSDSVIYYAGTAKQYSLDVAVFVVLMWLSLRAIESARPTRIAALIAAGCAAVWLSHPAVFVLVAIGVTLVVKLARDKQWRCVVVMGLGSAAWFGSFTLSYLVTLGGVKHLEKSYTGSSAFVGSGDNFRAALNDYLGVFRYEAGIAHASIFSLQDPGRWAASVAAVMFLVGCISLCVTKGASAGVLLGPLAVALAASAAQRYPLVPRTVLFAAPTTVIGIAVGGATIVRAKRRGIAIGIAACAVGFLALSLAVPALQHLHGARSREELKPVMRYLASAQRPNDLLYIYYPTQYAFRYYLTCGCFDGVAGTPRRRGLWPLTRFAGGRAQWAPALESKLPNFRVASYRGEQPSLYLSDLRSLKGRSRVWVILSDLPDASRAFLLRNLASLGHARAALKPGQDESAAGLYLFDLR